MATKLGLSLPPVHVPASCGWRASFVGRGWILLFRLSSDRDTLGDLQTRCSGYVSVLGEENTSGY